MFGTMQHWPLLAHKILDHAAIQHPNRAVISRSVEGPIHRTTYSEMHTRARQVAKRLTKDGIKLGDRVATLAWNTWRHMEVWYGLLGIGAVYHTVNPRLFPDQIAWPHQAVQGVDLADEVAFAKAADRGIARHHADIRRIEGQKCCFSACARGGRRRLATRVAGADHDDIERQIIGHESDSWPRAVI